MSTNSSKGDGAGFRSLWQLLDVWSQWSQQDTLEQAARRADAQGDIERAAELRELPAVEPSVSAVEALAAQHEVASLLAGWEWQTVRAAREQGTTWTQIATVTGTDPITARAAYLDKVERQAAAAAAYGWSWGMTAREADEHRAAAGDWRDQLRPTTPAHVQQEIAAAIDAGDVEELDRLQLLYWDPDHEPTSLVEQPREGREPDELDESPAAVGAPRALDPGEDEASRRAQLSLWHADDAQTAESAGVVEGDEREAGPR